MSSPKCRGMTQSHLSVHVFLANTAAVCLAKAQQTRLTSHSIILGEVIVVGV